MSNSIKPSDPRLTQLPMSQVDAPARATPVAPTAPSAPQAPLDQVSSGGPAVNLQGTSAVAPPSAQSTGLEAIKVLINDENFGVGPQVNKIGVDLTWGFQFDPQLLAADLGAFGAQELAAGGQRSEHLQALLKALPDALSPLDPALLTGID